MEGTLEFADSEDAVTSPEDIREIASFIEHGLGRTLKLKNLSTR